MASNRNHKLKFKGETDMSKKSVALIALGIVGVGAIAMGAKAVIELIKLKKLEKIAVDGEEEEA